MQLLVGATPFPQNGRSSPHLIIMRPAIATNANTGRARENMLVGNSLCFGIGSCIC